MFVDKVEVTIKAGDGGHGALSFHHEKFRAKGGPDGGDGGRGGDVLLAASRNQNTLAAFRYKKLIKAENGQNGGESKRHGKSGPDLRVEVPVGTVVIDERGQTIADLDSDGKTALVAKGGKGGYGNAHFASSRRQVPRVAEKGELGQNVKATFELKMIADVGIIGLPNAGKSTLLSVISNAKPEIANYPFTTLHPHLGVVDIEGRSLLFADIPGLIAGASQGKGLGDEFLRHVERTSVLLHLVDAYNDDVAAAYKTVIKELADYKVDLSRRPQVVALTKTEGLDKDQVNDAVAKLKRTAPKNTRVLAISSASHQGLNEMLRAVAKVVEQARSKRPAPAAKKLPVIGLKDSDDWRVVKRENAYTVTGRKIERFAQRTHFGDFHGEQRLLDIMAKMGIMRELQRQGLEPGQTITIGQPGIGQLTY